MDAGLTAAVFGLVGALVGRGFRLPARSELAGNGVGLCQGLATLTPHRRAESSQPHSRPPIIEQFDASRLQSTRYRSNRIEPAG
jgi:hypothetical protein